MVWQPANFVELGVLDGYSTLHIAKGIKWLHKHRGYMGKLDAYDLFEDYAYKHGQMGEVSDLLEENGVKEYVNLFKGDAYQAWANYPDPSPDVKGIEFLHIDISNTGKVIDEIMHLWHPKIAGRGLVLIEGGSEERDNVEWMQKYKGSSIKHEIETNPLINKYYQYGTYFKYPSITVLLKKWWDVDAK